MKFLSQGAAVSFALSAAFLIYRYSSPPLVTASTSVAVRDVRRLGVNLGLWTSWGAEQLSSNVIKNPGFEGNIDRSIVIVKEAGAGSFTELEGVSGRPDGFWTGASFVVRSGRKAGKSGRLVGSLARGDQGLPVYIVSPSATGGGTPAESGDVVALTRTDDSSLPADWWFDMKQGAEFRTERNDRRPDSPGVSSLRIHSSSGTAARVDSYLDAIGERAGRMLPVQGSWKLSFWARLDQGSARLNVAFRRGQSPAFVAADVPLSPHWQQFEYPFSGRDSGPAEMLDLRFEVTASPTGDVLLDDVELRRTSDTGPFRREAVEALRYLRPAYLRDWEGQLGDTFGNRVATSFARRTSRYRSGDISDADYPYGLPEFLRLASDVGASPWIVMPTTFSDGECEDLGAYLAVEEKRYAFREMLVEFGNENWNTLFRPAGIPVAAAHGAVADRCFHQLRRAATGVPLLAVINAQHANPAAAADFTGLSREADIVAVAPYLLHSLNTGFAESVSLERLFESDAGRLRKIVAAASSEQKEAAIYEVNLHTDEGTATDNERMRITSGQASGTAIAVRMLDSLAVGVRRQCIYTLAGFDNRAAGGHVRLWGIARDLASTLRLRPSAQAVRLVNQAATGDLMKSESTDSKIRGYVFRGDGRWSAVIASTSGKREEIRIEFPAAGLLPRSMLSLAADSPEATNEMEPEVRIDSATIHFEGRTAGIQLPPYGLAALVTEVPQ